MAKFNSEISTKESAAETLLVIQEAIKEFGWAVLELASGSVVVKAPPPRQGFMFQYQYSTKIVIILSESKTGTDVSIAATTLGWTSIAKRVIEGLVGQLVNAISIGAQKVKPQATGGVADELIKLSELLNSGILSQAEFDTAKAKILGN